MIPAQYLLVSYTADPARNEPANVGIVIWNADRYRIVIDDLAVEQVIRANPHLAKDALLYLQGVLEDRLTSDARISDESVTKALEAQPSWPVTLSEPRLTTLTNESGPALEEALDRLLARIVRPRRRHARRGTSPKQAVEAALRSLLKRNLLEKNRGLAGRYSGIPRVVDFFLNSGRNVALDVVQFDVTRADEIRHRADAEAYKVHDVVSSPGAPRFYVYTHFAEDPKLLETNDHAYKILDSAGASVLADIETVRDVMHTAADKSPND